MANLFIFRKTVTDRSATIHLNRIIKYEAQFSKAIKQILVLEDLKNIWFSNDQKHLSALIQSHLHKRQSLLLKYLRFFVPNSTAKPAVLKFIQTLFGKIDYSQEHQCDIAVIQCKEQKSQQLCPLQTCVII